MADYISREAVLAFAKDIVFRYEDGTTYKHRCIDPQCIREIPPADVFTAKEKAELIKLLKIHVKPVAKVVLDENYYSLWSRIEFCLNASICADMRPEQRKEEK